MHLFHHSGGEDLVAAVLQIWPMARSSCLVAFCILLIWLTARPAFPQKPASSASRLFALKGWASWYGDKWRNHFTASGEKFKPEELTAASPTLPLGSIIEVTNLFNGKVVQLVVNDRGPFEGNRILDVSRAAAELLGFLASGVTRVRVRLLETAEEARKTGDAKLQTSHP